MWGVGKETSFICGGENFFIGTDYNSWGVSPRQNSKLTADGAKIGSIFLLKTLDKWRDLTYTLCIMGIRAPIYIGFLTKDKREKNSLKNRVG